MKTGKLSELVLSRSVLKKIKNKRNEVVQGARVGADAAVMKVPGELVTAVACSGSFGFLGQSFQEQESSLARELISPELTAIHAVNSVAAEGGKPFALQIAMILPENMEEPLIKKVMDAFANVAERLDLQIAGGHSEVSSYVTSPVYSVTAYGYRREWQHNMAKENVWGQDIVMTKAMGLEGTGLMAAFGKNRLEKRFSKAYVEAAMVSTEELEVVSEAQTATDYGVTCMHDLSETGVFGGLWELGEKLHMGLEVSLTQIPVRQETIELSEYLDVNPFLMPSAGSMLIVTADGAGLVKVLEEKGIDAAVIGKMTQGNDKVVVHHEERRFLEQPR